MFQRDSLQMLNGPSEADVSSCRINLIFDPLNAITFLAEGAFTSFHYTWYTINLLHPSLRFIWKWVHSPVWQLCCLKRGKGPSCILFLLVRILAFSYIHMQWQSKWGSWSWPSNWNL